MVSYKFHTIYGVFHLFIAPAIIGVPIIAEAAEFINALVILDYCKCIQQSLVYFIDDQQRILDSLLDLQNSE